MFLVGILSWWYGNGWVSRIRIIKARIAASADFFSVELLASTLFEPFRQISAGHVGGSISDKFKAFGDRLLSRTIGAVTRSFMIIFGMIVMAVEVMFGLITVLVWLFIPLLPALGLVMAVIGWVPQ